MTLVDGIDLGAIDKEYDLAKVLIDSDNSKTSDSEPTDLTTNAPQIPEPLVTAQAIVNRQKIPESLVTAQAVAAYQVSDVLDKICAPCVGSKSTRTVRRHKCMTPTTAKLEQVHIDFWGPHNPPSQSGSIYFVILIYENTQKTWTLYLRGKDDFVNAFQIWLFRVEAVSGCSIKTLRADGGREFISIKL